MKVYNCKCEENKPYNIKRNCSTNENEKIYCNKEQRLIDLKNKKDVTILEED